VLVSVAVITTTPKKQSNLKPVVREEEFVEP
jgi:hypothetical protein